MVMAVDGFRLEQATVIRGAATLLAETGASIPGGRHALSAESGFYDGFCGAAR